MLKLADMAVRPDACFGQLTVSPARRIVKGPEGEVHVEPRVMQVFLLLLDADGRVVTRNEIFEQCWGAAMVGDDNINRAIAAIRRIADEVAPGAFEVETIPRTGYRLVWADAEPAEAPADNTDPAEATSSSRRNILIGGTAALVAAGTAGILWTALRPRPDPRFEALMQRGKDAIRLDEPGAAKFFERAVAIEPKNAKAWGLLAYALGSGGYAGPAGVDAQQIEAAERAARTALAIDRNEPNALLAMTFVEIGMLDWFAQEERYRRILAIDPQNPLVMWNLGFLLSGVGRCREALAMVERVTSIEPMYPDAQRRKAMGLWVNGRVPEADRVIDRAMQLWPSHRLIRMARLMIYAFTGRTQAALAIVDEEEANPILLSPSAAAVWRLSLVALEDRSSADIALARTANLDGARKTPATSAYAIPILSALGELDAAFEVANGFLLGRGSVIVRPRPETKVPTVNAPGWRNTFGLFVPPAKAMRLDPRFKALAEGLGLTEYWRKRGIGPDAFLFKP